jgi:hypothetical protein|tara:strand:+ start:1510 stop:1773 length:264 start_codon:yes stop_codon:yes gene_type:complete
MITEKDIYDHKRKYPTFDAEGMIDFLDKAGYRRPKGFASRSIASAQRYRKFMKGINRMVDKELQVPIDPRDKHGNHITEKTKIEDLF